MQITCQTLPFFQRRHKLLLFRQLRGGLAQFFFCRFCLRHIPIACP